MIKIMTKIREYLRCVSFEDEEGQFNKGNIIGYTEGVLRGQSHLGKSDKTKKNLYESLKLGVWQASASESQWSRRNRR